MKKENVISFSNMIKTFLVGLLFVILLFSLLACSGDNIDDRHITEKLENGTYHLDASFSCYIPAMGGIEFAEPVFASADFIIDNNNKTIKLNLKKGELTIYSIKTYVFVDKNPNTDAENTLNIALGTIGYYDNDSKLITDNVTYTQSLDTATNSKGEDVNYVDSISFPFFAITNNINLALYINSNTMGKQFCEKTESNSGSTYSAILTINWDSLQGK